MSFLKKLFHSRREPAPQAAATPAPTPMPAAPTPAAAAEAPAIPPSGSVCFPLKAITDLLPERLASTMRKPASEHVRVHFSGARLGPQLAEGALRVTYAELCAASPPIFFDPNAAPAETPIDLPMAVALPQLTYARREEQRQPVVPANIPSIFQKARPDAEAPKPQPSPRPVTESAPAAPVPNAAPEPVTPESHGECLGLPIARLIPGAPGVFRIPLDELEEPMRAGRVVLPWSLLGGWASESIDVPQGEVEIPLPEIVPAYLAKRPAPAPRGPAVEVDKHIPDLFAPARARQAAIPAPAPVAQVPAEPTRVVPASPEPRAAASRADAAPARVVEALRKLGGIQGAFVATSDGMLVAGDTPSANGNVLAAFAPTMFAQVTRYADMARLGAPEAIDIRLGGETAIHVRRAGKLYVGLLRPAAHPLPDIAPLTGSLLPTTT